MSIWSGTDATFCSLRHNRTLNLTGLPSVAYHIMTVLTDIGAVPSAKCLIFKGNFFCKENIAYSYFFMSQCM